MEGDVLQLRILCKRKLEDLSEEEKDLMFKKIKLDKDKYVACSITANVLAHKLLINPLECRYFTNFLHPQNIK